MFWLLVAAGTIVIGGGAYAIARLTRAPEGAQRLLDLPVVRIGDAADATAVKLEGTVESIDDLVAGPLSGTRCVYFEHTVEEVIDAGALGGAAALAGIVVHRASGGVPFVLRDRSGYAIVDPRGATALLRVDHEGGQGGSTAGRAFRRWMGVPAARGRHHLEKERLVVPGDRIVVIGRGVREPDPDPTKVEGSYRDGAPTRLRLMHAPEFPLHLLDLT